MDRSYLEDVPEDIQDLLYEGKKIDAIKRTREELGLGLKESKEKIDAIQAAMEKEFPGALPKPQGCAAVLLVGLSLLGAATYGASAMLS